MPFATTNSSNRRAALQAFGNLPKANKLHLLA